MVIRKALEEDAAVAGEVHSKAWKQTYQGIFDQEYIDKDSFYSMIEDNRELIKILTSIVKNTE